MDSVPAPNGESLPLKGPATEVETINTMAAGKDTQEENGNGKANGTENLEETVVALAEEVSQSEYETDSDESGEWETQSLYEDALQILHGDQLRDGSGTCSTRSPDLSCLAVCSYLYANFFSV